MPIASSHSIAATTALDWLAAGRHSMLDVRSEGEFASASIPGFASAPILHDHERHQVGLCYRLQGQDAAIELGYKLVMPTQSARVDQWLQASPVDQTIVLCCWRGGLRSRIASEWVADRGREVLVVNGGYKALRHELLKALEQPPALQILSGLTGAGKTRLLEALPIREKVNIEDLAAHRGSSFGRMRQRPQPSQTTFENRLGLALRACARPVLVEDESKVIGQLHLPEVLHRRLIQAPLIVLEAGLDERARQLAQEYVGNELKAGVARADLEQTLIASTGKLQRRLGGLLTASVTQQIRSAFASTDETAHEQWIAALLRDYYDPRYRHALARNERVIAFQGNYEECREWILNQYV